MVDLRETPAVPPMDTGGDDRLGFRVAGAVLVVLGWGIADLLNVLLHRAAPTAGLAVGPYTVFPAFGLLGEITFVVGLFTGLIGVGLLWVAESAPRGPLVVPGYPY